VRARLAVVLLFRVLLLRVSLGDLCSSHYGACSIHVSNAIPPAIRMEVVLLSWCWHDRMALRNSTSKAGHAAIVCEMHTAHCTAVETAIDHSAFQEA
jgi:hypothetical protein